MGRQTVHRNSFQELRRLPQGSAALGSLDPYLPVHSPYTAVWSRRKGMAHSCWIPCTFSHVSSPHAAAISLQLLHRLQNSDKGQEFHEEKTRKEVFKPVTGIITLKGLKDQVRKQWGWGWGSCGIRNITNATNKSESRFSRTCSENNICWSPSSIEIPTAAISKGANE